MSIDDFICQRGKLPDIEDIVQWYVQLPQLDMYSTDYPKYWIERDLEEKIEEVLINFKRDCGCDSGFFSLEEIDVLNETYRKVQAAIFLWDKKIYNHGNIKGHIIRNCSHFGASIVKIDYAAMKKITKRVYWPWHFQETISESEQNLVKKIIIDAKNRFWLKTPEGVFYQNYIKNLQNQIKHDSRMAYEKLTGIKTERTISEWIPKKCL